MPSFAYTARAANGQKVNGVLSANNPREAAAQLAGQNLFPLEVKAEQANASAVVGGWLGGNRVGGQVMATTYGQLAALLRSGVPLLRSLNVLRGQTSHRRLKEVLDDVYDHVEQGVALGEAMARHPRVFSEMAINMVRAGAEGGFLEDALDRVAQFTEESEDLKSRTMGALAYPVFLATVGSLLVTTLVVFFVPKFAVMFDRLRERGELPWMTDFLLGVSDTLRGYWWLILLAAVVAFVFAQARLATPEGRRLYDALKLRLPLAGKIFLNLAVARFCRVLGTLLRNGVPIIKSLEISRDAGGNRVLAEAIAAASENITSGQSLARPLSASGHFPATVVEMIAVAEESNTLDRVLVEISDGLERRTSRQLDLMVRLLEPLMLLMLAGVVMFVVVALLLPIINMSAAL